jgi:hypothetical protein
VVDTFLGFRVGKLLLLLLLLLRVYTKRRTWPVNDSSRRRRT